MVVGFCVCAADEGFVAKLGSEVGDGVKGAGSGGFVFSNDGPAHPVSDVEGVGADAGDVVAGVEDAVDFGGVLFLGDDGDG